MSGTEDCEAYCQLRLGHPEGLAPCVAPYLPLNITETITGHIDVVQIRNGKIHILDYKTGANKEKPITQLMVYALVLSRRTGLRLYDFVCAWFDEHHYFDFILSTSCTSAGAVRAFIDFLRTRRREEVLPDIQWVALSEASLGNDWDNEADAVYDDWQKHYEVQAG